MKHSQTNEEFTRSSGCRGKALARRQAFISQILNRVGVLSLAAVFCLLAACGGGDAELREYIKQVSNRTAKPIKPLPKFEPVPGYTYASTGKRSPFLKAVSEDDRGVAPDLSRPKEPLEKFALDALHFVGTFLEDNHLWALISAPDNAIHTVKVGNYLGQNHGKITLINDKEIQVEERVLTPEGWKPHNASLVLKSDNSQ